MHELLQYARMHVGTTIAIGVGLMGAVYFVLTRKPASTRDAERRLAELREKQRDHYREMRPPK